jgi:hypothetical protein
MPENNAINITKKSKFNSKLVGTMFLFYNNYLNNIGVKGNDFGVEEDSTPLLPSFTSSGSDDSGETLADLKLDTGTVLDNLNKVDGLKSDEEALKGAKLVQIEKSPVADYVLAKKIASGTEPELILRYFRISTGEIVDYNLLRKEKTVLSLEKQEGIEEATFSKNGEYLVTRKFDGEAIISKLIFIQTNTVYDLDKNITSIDFFENNNLVYGIKKGDGYIIKLLDVKKQKVTDLATLPMTEWSIEASIDGSVRAVVKPSGEAEGVSVTVNPKTGKIQNEIKPINGLTVKKTNDKKYLIMTEGGVGYNNLLFFNKNNQNIYNLQANTFIDKCASEVLKGGIVCAVPDVLDKRSLYPDTFYKSLLQSKDKIIYKSLISTSTKLIYTFGDAKFSAENLTISAVGFYFQDSRAKGLYTLE